MNPSSRKSYKEELVKAKEKFAKLGKRHEQLTEQLMQLESHILWLTTEAVKEELKAQRIKSESVSWLSKTTKKRGG